ncbi:L,D-transpeptidase family protein [Propionibacteriaceae bacterium G1746]|uniref:L,D-transpeptidase family protein n=1 Tax=Aestuariimicrobium sp. G57 TaxID=3418485 RepID=UPI003C293054
MNKRIVRVLTAATAALAMSLGSLFIVTDAQAEVTAPAEVTVYAKPGDTGTKVQEVQAMLFRIGLLRLNERTGTYDAATTNAVKSFQSQKKFTVTGVTDSTTYEYLVAAYRATSTPDLQKKTVVRKVAAPLPKPTPPAVADVVKYQLDSRCDDEAKVICADQSRRKVWYLENGKVVKEFDARYGAASTPTRNGAWRIFRKVKDEWSYLYHVPMPYSMYFSGGEAFHYSADFAQIGWDNSRGGSHGCVNIRDYAGIAWMFNRVPIGTLTIVTA